MFTKKLQNLTETYFKVCDKIFVINDQILCYEFIDFNDQLITKLWYNFAQEENKTQSHRSKNGATQSEKVKINKKLWNVSLELYSLGGWRLLIEIVWSSCNFYPDHSNNNKGCNPSQLTAEDSSYLPSTSKSDHFACFQTSPPRITWRLPRGLACEQGEVIRNERVWGNFPYIWTIQRLCVPRWHSGRINEADQMFKDMHCLV